MNFQIIVGQNGKFLFKTDLDSCQSSGQLVRMFSEFTQKFPASEGYYWIIELYWKRSVVVDTKEFIEAIMQGKGKGFITKIRNRKRRADWMSFLLYKHIEEGVL